MWKREDQFLLERLEDEQILEELWRIEARGSAPLHPRAAGLIHELRATDEGSDAIARATSGEWAPLLEAVHPSAMRGRAGTLLHHLAVYNARVADSSHDATEQERARLCSLAAWIALADEGSYLRKLVSAVLDDEDVQDAIAQAALVPLDELGERATAGARERDEPSRRALSALGHVSDACRMSGCAATVESRFERHAARLRARAIDVALAPIREAVSDATARGQAEREGAALMQRVADVWHWAGGDEHIERFAVDTVTPIAWNVYHEEHSDRALRQLIAPLEPLVDRLGWRIEADGSRIAYAASCAQMFVFRSEVSTSAIVRRRWAERSLQICPSHRNGRLILASLLVHEVRDHLDRSPLFLMGAKMTELEAQLSRAEELYPRTRGLDDLKQRLADAKEKSWWR